MTRGRVLKVNSSENKGKELDKENLAVMSAKTLVTLAIQVKV